MSTVVALARGSVAAAALLWSALTGCTEIPVDDVRYPCVEHAECGSGWHCNAPGGSGGVCKPGLAPDAGPDAEDAADVADSTAEG